MGKKFIVIPTPEEQRANFEDYQSKKARMEELQAEYQKTKDALKCSYCGNRHYIVGSGKACYQYIRMYGTPERRYQNREETQGVFFRTGGDAAAEKVIDNIYYTLADFIHKNYDNNFDVTLDERTNWVKSIFDMFPPNRDKTNECRGYNVAMQRINNGLTYEVIGRSYGLTKQRVRQLVVIYVDSVKRRLKAYCAKQMREDGYVHF